MGAHLVTGIPLYFAFPLGCLMGLLLYGPVKRWIVTLRRTLLDISRRRGTQRNGTVKLLVIFATMHPAPWLLLIGLPYGVYRLWLDPLRPMWSCVLAGALLAPALFALYESRTASLVRQAQGAHAGGRANGPCGERQSAPH